MRFDGFSIVYCISPGQLAPPQYLTPQYTWSPHRYAAEVYRSPKDLNAACAWVRQQGCKPSVTLSDEQPPRNEQ